MRKYDPSAVANTISAETNVSFIVSEDPQSIFWGAQFALVDENHSRHMIVLDKDGQFHWSVDNADTWLVSAWSICELVMKVTELCEINRGKLTSYQWLIEGNHWKTKMTKMSYWAKVQQFIRVNLIGLDPIEAG